MCDIIFSKQAAMNLVAKSEEIRANKAHQQPGDPQPSRTVSNVAVRLAVTTTWNKLIMNQSIFKMDDAGMDDVEVTKLDSSSLRHTAPVKQSQKTTMRVNPTYHSIPITSATLSLPTEFLNSGDDGENYDPSQFYIKELKMIGRTNTTPFVMRFPLSELDALVETECKVDSKPTEEQIKWFKKNHSSESIPWWLQTFPVPTGQSHIPKVDAPFINSTDPESKPEEDKEEQPKKTHSVVYTTKQNESACRKLSTIQTYGIPLAPESMMDECLEVIYNAKDCFFISASTIPVHQFFLMVTCSYFRPFLNIMGLATPDEEEEEGLHKNVEIHILNRNFTTTTFGPELFLDCLNAGAPIEATGDPHGVIISRELFGVFFEYVKFMVTRSNMGATRDVPINLKEFMDLPLLYCKKSIETTIISSFLLKDKEFVYYPDKSYKLDEVISQEEFRHRFWDAECEIQLDFLADLIFLRECTPSLPSQQ